MAKITGGRINLGVARETTRGTCVNPTYWIPWVNFGFDDKVLSKNSLEALGVIDDSHEKHVLEKWGEGVVDGEVRDDSFGLYLYALLGTCSSANVAGSTYDHTFTLANTNQHTSLTLSTEDPNNDKQYCLAMVSSMDINLVLGELVKYSINFISRESHDTAADSDKGSFGVEDKFRCVDATFKLAANRAGLSGASATKLQSLTISFNKNLLRKHMLGTVSPDDIINQAFAVEGSFTLPYEDQTYRNLMLDNTYQAMELEVKNESVTYGDGSNPTITITLPRCGFMDWTPSRPKGTLAEQTIGFKGYRDHANSEDSVYSIVLRNETASY